uniref:Uncharacterized protein n=1 Tax=Tanacetum cinerariifolium TaxID=118510 RepID=A0A699HSY3_TANCI|nr:hypothetical protein [Tanacetum cinerariifolium]
MDQLEKQLDKEECQEIGSMAAFKYFLEYTQLEIQEFRDTLIQHMKYVKKSIDKRAQHKRVYESRVNEREMQTTEEKVDTSKALDASLVITECSATNMEKQDTSSKLRNHADIKLVYDEEPMAEGKESACAKLHHVIAPGSSTYNSNDMVHNHYPEEAKKNI